MGNAHVEGGDVDRIERAILRAKEDEMTMLAVTVKTRATTLDVYVDGKRVGWVTDCGDCWRASLYDRRRRRALMNVDYDSRSQAVRGVVNAV